MRLRPDLSDPSVRRGLRSVVQTIVSLVLLALVWNKSNELAEGDLYSLLRLALGIILVGTVGYQFENGVRAFDFKFGDLTLNAQGKDSPAQPKGDDTEGPTNG